MRQLGSGLTGWFERLSVPLWLVLACGILAGAMVAQQVSEGHAAEPTPPPVIAADPAGAPVPAAAATPAAPASPAAPATPTAAPARPSGITFLDSPRGDARPEAAAAQPAPRTSGGGFERIVIMMAVLAGGVGALLLWKKKKAGAPNKPHTELAVVGQVRVAGRWSVALVKVPGKTLVVGATDKGLSLLSTIGEEDIPGDSADERLEEQAFEPASARGVDYQTSRAVPPRPPMPGSPASSTEPFGRLLDQLVRSEREAPPAARERMKTPEASALRARLERYQTGPN